MSKVLIIGSSGGIGAAFAAQYQSRGAQVSTLSRSENGFDLRDPASIEAVLSAQEGPFDTVIVATGALYGAGQGPEKSLRALSAEAMADQFAVNTIGPAMILRHLPRLLPRDRRGVCAVLSARVGSIGDNHLGGWYSYRAAKAAVNQVIRSASIELRRTHPQSVLLALHPGTVATEFTANFPKKDKLTPAQSAAHLAAVIDGKTPEQTGTFWDWKDTQVPW